MLTVLHLPPISANAKRFDELYAGALQLGVSGVCSNSLFCSVECSKVQRIIFWLEIPASAGYVPTFSAFQYLLPQATDGNGPDVSVKGIFQCKFNPWSKSPRNCVRLPLEKSS